MLPAILALQFVALLAVVVLLTRKPAEAEPATHLAQLPDQLSRLIADEARRPRDENAASATALRLEVIGSITTLGSTLKEALDGFRTDNANTAAALREEVEQKMHSISLGFSDLKSETSERHSALKESLTEKLGDLQEKAEGAFSILKTDAEKLEQVELGLTVRKNSFSTSAIVAFFDFAMSARNFSTPSERVGPASTEFTVTPVPAVVPASPLASATCIVLVTP